MMILIGTIVGFKVRKIIPRQIYHIFLGSLLVTVNITFFIFVGSLSALAPNSALAIVTIPFAIYEFYKGYGLNKNNSSPNNHTKHLNNSE